MPPFIPSLVLILLLAGPALLNPSTSTELEVRGQRTPRDTKQDSIKVVISEACATQGDSSDTSQGGKEIDLAPGSPLVLTHKIKLVPSDSGSGSCGCDADFAALRERLERLEREVSALREKCEGHEGNCCTSKESKGGGCSIKPETECPNECSDQGRCVDGKCICFPGYSGPDCSKSDCPGNCNNNGRCVDGQCVCDPGFTGPDCSQSTCPNNCKNRGRCVNGRCVCDSNFSGPSCSDESCPGNCNNRGRCVNGQCVCNPGFTGPDCSQRVCPNDCNDHGRCVNGKCICDSGFTGNDCSESSCPGNCNNRGRCVNGQCVCNPGFTGPDCSQRVCPNDCNDHGRCVNGKCICDSGFTGNDCSESSCPGNCNNRGRCINGQCVCDDGFTGDDCSDNSCPGNCHNRGRCVNGQCVCDDGFAGDDCAEKVCPNNCSKHGKCVNGKCVCEAGFTGLDCATKGCPNNCSNKGRCVRGSCVCRRGFTGPDCSQCLEGRTGPNCDTVIPGVSQLSTQEITETSVTLVWTPPPVQYETYHLTFTSQKESDQQITVQVEGSLTTFTQTGLAAGQEYSVSIVGEIDNRRGAEISTEFVTLISGPTNLQVVKTTSTSAVVQWEQSQGEIDRYLLTVTPNDGAGRSQEMTIPSGQNSAHIQQLGAGRLYDVILVAQKGSSQSEPATTQAVPGQWVPRPTTAALTMQGTQDVGGIKQELNPSSGGEVFDQQGRKQANSKSDSAKVRDFDRPDSSTVIARTKPLVSKMMTINGTRSKFEGRPTLSRKSKVPGSVRFNTTRVVPGGKKILPGPLKKAPVVAKKKEPRVHKKPEPGVSTTEDSVIVEASSSVRRDDKNPTMTPGTGSETNSSEKPTPAVGSKEQPDVGMASHGNDADLASPEPTGTIQGQEKKCMNKIKVTHIRLPLKDRGNGCIGQGKGLPGNTLSSNPGSPITSDTPPTGETDLDHSPDPLNTLLADTFKGLNITTFSVHLARPSDASVDAEKVRMQILRGLKPLSSFSPSSLLTSKSSSHSSAVPSLTSSLTPLVSSASTAAPSSSLRHLIASSLSPPPPSSSSSDEISPLGSNELDVDNNKGTTDSVSLEDRRVPPLGEHQVPLVHHTPPKRGYVRYPQSNFRSFLNKTNLNLRVPHRSPPRFVSIPKRETETSELSSSLFSSASKESSSDEVNAPVKDTSGGKGGKMTPASSVVEQNHNKRQTERGQIPFRWPPPKGGPLRRPFLKNQTRPNLRPLSRPSQPLNPEAENEKQSEFTTPFPATSAPSLSKDSYPSNTGPVKDGTEDGIETRMSTTSLSTESNQTARVNGVPSSHRPDLKVGFFRRTQPYGGSFQNRTRTNQRPPQYTKRGPVHKPLPTRKLNTGTTITAVGQTRQLGQDGTPENQSGAQDIHRLNQGGQMRQSGGQEASEVTPNYQIDTTVRPQTKELRNRDNTLIETEETGTADFDIHEDSVDPGKSTGTPIRGRPTFKQTPLHSRPSRPVVLPKRPPPTRTFTRKHNTQVRQYISGSQKEEDPKTSNTEKTASVASDVSLSGITREPLDFVGVTNQTSDGFTLIWDSPEGKYKNFVVTSTEKIEGPKQMGRKEEVEEDSDKDGGSETGKEKHHPNKEPESENGGTDNDNTITEGSISQVPKIQSSSTTKPTENDKTFKKVLHGSARSFQFEDLPPKTEYTLTLLGKGPGLLSRLHKLVISTGPEPPTNIVFSKVTENSLTVSWTKPKSPVSGFKVTYTHTDDGEPVSVTVDSEDSNLGLSQLSPGSSYEVTVISTLGLDESDPIKDFVMTLPDPPTNLQAVNVTDSKALLLWRPALAAVDKYAIVYGSGTDSELRVTVSGNAAEQQLSGLEGSTTYTVTITSQLGSLQSSAATTSFTTTGGPGRDGNGPQDLQANNVTPRTAMLSWKPPSKPVARYRLTYQTEGQEMKEVIVDATVTHFNLRRLHPGSKYVVQLQAEREGRYTSAIATEFTTGTLRFPFPTDCSQELLNGIYTSGEVEIFPQGKLGTPMLVYCDMETDGGGWTVFQRRKDGSVDFFRGWKEYIKGFGDVNGEFWLGLESLHNLTAMTKMSLRVDLRDGDESVFAQYSTFEVAKRNYKLTVGGYTGTAGDSLTYHNNRIFSTKDRDPATFITRCAMSYRGGWWYKNCHEANLNGLYGIDVKHQGVIWTSWKGKEVSIPFTEMKMRPTAFSPPARG